MPNINCLNLGIEGKVKSNFLSYKTLCYNLLHLILLASYCSGQYSCLHEGDRSSIPCMDKLISKVSFSPPSGITKTSFLKLEKSVITSPSNSQRKES